MKVKRRIVKVGNSLMISIPSHLNFKEGMELNVSYENGKLIYTPENHTSEPETQTKTKITNEQTQNTQEPETQKFKPEPETEKPEFKRSGADLLGEWIGNKILELFNVKTKRTDEESEMEYI